MTATPGRHRSGAAALAGSHLPCALGACLIWLCGIGCQEPGGGYSLRLIFAEDSLKQQVTSVRFFVFSPGETTCEALLESGEVPTEPRPLSQAEIVFPFDARAVLPQVPMQEVIFFVEGRDAALRRVVQGCETVLLSSRVGAHLVVVLERREAGGQPGGDPVDPGGGVDPIVTIGPCRQASDCEDHNPCTADACGLDGFCQNERLTGGCDDQNPCTSQDQCQAGQCRGTAYSCDDLDPCTADSCLGDGTCVHAPDPNGCLPWVPIPGGLFSMGQDTGTDLEDDEKPVHGVTVPSFSILQSEVTVRQFQACVNQGKCTPPRTDPANYCNWGVANRQDHPVNCVDWNQGDVFCRAVGGRLPTEAQWEFAARGGDRNVRFPWGDATPDCSLAVMVDPQTVIHGCGLLSTAPVCSKPAGSSAQGVCDLAGNVWEWVQDWYHPSYTQAPSDGSAWEHPAGTERVRRGGCWGNVEQGLRTRNRSKDMPDTSTNGVGFRCTK